MAGESDRLSALYRERYDDAALAALASKGLLRRAAKDLARVPVVLETASAPLAIRVGAETVELDERGPRQARCSCPGFEICRHILTAVLFLRNEPGRAEAPAVDPAALEAEILALDPEKLATKRVVREAIAVLGADPEPEIELGESLRVFFPESLVEVRWFPGGGYQGAITDARGRDPEKYLVAAILALRKRRGHPGPEQIEAAALAAAEGAPRTRAEVLGSATSLFEEMIDAGLTHLTETAEARLTTLAISAVGVNLPRLALELKRTADDTALMVERRAQSDEARLFGAVSRAYALAAALGSAKDEASSELVGRHRTRYREIGALELSGLGAYPWRTSSGYLGLTVVFRESRSGEWYAWSDSRPAQYAEYSPEARYRAPGPWEGMRDPALASRSRFKLFHARRNDQHRLSASTRSKAQVIGPSDPSELAATDRVFADFDRLRGAVERARPAGLGSYDPIAGLAVVRPARFGARSFDEIRQVFVLEVFDADQRPLVLGVSHGAANEAAIEALERLDPDAVGLWGLMGRAYLAEGQLRMRPYSLYTRDGIVNLGLDGGAPAPGAGSEEASAPHEGEEEREPEAPIDSASLHRLRAFESMLEELAEMGRGALNERRRSALLGAARSLEEAGLPILAGAASAIAGASAAEAPCRILRGRYLTGVHRELSASA